MKIATDVPENVGTLWAGALWAHCGFCCGYVVGKLWANCMCTRCGSVVMFVEGASSWKLLHNTPQFP